MAANKSTIEKFGEGVNKKKLKNLKAKIDV